jgi:arginase family enzyme
MPSKFLTSSPRKVSVIGCPFSGGQPKPGVDDGPMRLVEAGLYVLLLLQSYLARFADIAYHEILALIELTMSES